MSNYCDKKHIIEKILNVKCDKTIYFDDPHLSKKNKLLLELGAITNKKILNNEYKYINAFCHNLALFYENLKKFDEKIVKLINILDNDCNYRNQNYLDFLTSLYTRHYYWKERACKTIDIFNNEGISLEEKCLKINKITFSVSLIDTIIFHKLDFFKKNQVYGVNNMESYYFCSNDNKLISAGLNLYDIAIYRTICTIYDCGFNIISNNMIVKVLSGKKNNKLEKLQKDDISKSITRIKNTSITIIDKNGNKIVKENLIYLLEKKNIIKILRDPILYRIGKFEFKTIKVPIEVMETPNSFTKTNIIIKEFLIFEILYSEWDKANTIRINIDKIYNILNSKSSQLRKKIRNHIINILCYWKDINYISDYYLEKHHNKFTHIVIEKQF
ncbi:hypothetical protein [Peptostreptococcus faecalis]|uniref:hypothetical protein n=1 Tax=Peptostreptococcus faecalis TaxID=2045015 RepID=UPI000C7C001B|nr:hypothetical protein [Peptostreptococcus faecalis]